MLEGDDFSGFAAFVNGANQLLNLQRFLATDERLSLFFHSPVIILDLPDVAEAGTVNVPGIAGLYAGIDYVNRMGIQKILSAEQTQAHRCAEGLREMGLRVYAGPYQSGTVSFLPAEDCEEVAQKLADRGIAVRAGLHCAPLAHKTAGTLSTGTLRVSFGHHATRAQTDAFLQAIRGLL